MSGSKVNRQVCFRCLHESVLQYHVCVVEYGEVGRGTKTAAWKG